MKTVRQLGMVGVDRPSRNVIDLFLFRFLAQVPADALVFFREAAEALIEDRGAVDAVAAALAHISGTTEIKTRSMLSSQEVSHLIVKSLGLAME